METRFAQRRATLTQKPTAGKKSLEDLPGLGTGALALLLRLTLLLLLLPPLLLRLALCSRAALRLGRSRL